MTQNRPSRTGLALAAVGAMIFVGGTLWSVLSAEEAEIEGERPRPPLEEVLGEPRDAGVRATLDVDEVLSTSEEQAPTEVVIYDRGFRESWSEGQEMVVFLGAEGGLPQGAEFRVVERCILEEGSLPCPYDLDEI
jgi:hypothetical protein